MNINQILKALVNLVTPKIYRRSKLATLPQPVRRPPLTNKRKRTVKPQW